MSPLAVIEAVVQVGAEETRYLRCGCGSHTIVVLAEDAAQREQLMARFAGRNRVIAPVVDVCPPSAEPNDGTIQRWLRGVIDGLGLERPVVALSPALAGLAERLVSDCGDSLDFVLSVTAR